MKLDARVLAELDGLAPQRLTLFVGPQRLQVARGQDVFIRRLQGVDMQGGDGGYVALGGGPDGVIRGHES